MQESRFSKVRELRRRGEEYCRSVCACVGKGGDREGLSGSVEEVVVVVVVENDWTSLVICFFLLERRLAGLFFPFCYVLLYFLIRDSSMFSS